MEETSNTRRNFLLSCLGIVGASVLWGLGRKIENWVLGWGSLAEDWTRRSQRLMLTQKSLAREFRESDISPVFRSNGFSQLSAEFEALQKNHFADYRLQIGGLVEKPLSLSMKEIKSLSARTQITRHDCVEGWSVIGKWKGVPLSVLLDQVRPLPSARFVVFYSGDQDKQGNRYYESIDLQDAVHPQTLLAYELNDQTLPLANGAPLRLRLERQLGYKMPKHIMRMELVESYAQIRGGKGGYWEDLGYEWYAGI